MVLTLDHLDQHIHTTRKHHQTSSFLKEMGALVGIFAGVFVIGVVFINLGLLYQTALDRFGDEKMHAVAPLGPEATLASSSITTLLHTPIDELKQQIEQQISSYTGQVEQQEDPLLSMQTLLKSRMASHTFEFNMVPPNNTLRVASVGIQAPIIDLYYKSADHLKEGDFDKELYHGVVKYPSTPTPDKKGNMLIFGHTSYYRWKHNGYGTIFSKLPKIKHGEEIQLTWQGQLYTYEVVETIVVWPKDVDDVYLKYKDDHYLTLMGCYPLGSDQRRMLVIAKKKPQKNLTYKSNSQSTF